METLIKSKKWLIITIIFALPILSMFLHISKHKDVYVVVDGQEVLCETKANTVEDLLSELNISLKINDYINSHFNEEIYDHDKIVIKRAVPISIKSDNKIIKIESTANTIDEVLNTVGIILDDDDKLYPENINNISPNMQIQVVRVDKKTNKETIEIPYTKVIKYNENIKSGETEKLQLGEVGLKEINKEFIYEDGVLVSETVVSEQIIKQPVPEILEVGSKNQIVVSRGEFLYSKVLSMEATAYDLSYQSIGKRPGDANYGITASGTMARPGVVAVDPKFIPLGTKLYIQSLDSTEDYGFAVAEDIGGDIKNNRIDLFFESHREALAFGRRKVKVYILDK